MIPALDPAAVLVLRAALALLLLSSAAHKLRDPRAFRQAVERYEIAPPAWTDAAAALVLILEFGLGIAVLVEGRAALGAAALLAAYALAIGVNLRRGRRDIDCGCTGPARRLPLAWSLVARNLVLVALAAAAALPAGSRALVWVDAVTVAAGAAFCAVLYAAAETALANAGRGRRLRPEPLPEAA